LAKNRLGTGEIKETVTQERVIRPDEQADELASSAGDVFELAAMIPPEEYNTHMLYVYRTAPERVQGYIGKLTLPFDEETIRFNYGGGTYRLMLKRGSEIRKTSNVPFVGEPKTDVPVSAAPAASITSKTELVQAMELIMKNNPNAMNAEMMKTAFLNALDIQRAAAASAQMKPNEIVQMMGEMHRINGGGSSAMPEWVTQVVTALIPVGVGLLQTMLTPKNPVTELTNIATAFGQIKSLAGESGPPTKVDYGAELIRNAPGILGKVAEIMAEGYKATSLRVAAEQARAQANGPITIQPTPSAHSNPAIVAPPAVILPATGSPTIDSQVTQGAPTPEWVQARATKMMADGTSAAFVLDYIEEQGVPIQVNPEWVMKCVAEMVEAKEEAEAVVACLRKWLPPVAEAIRTLPPDVLREQIRTDPFLSKLVTLPHFEQFLRDFHAKLQEGAPLAN
jgi:hypothetical protein